MNEISFVEMPGSLKRADVPNKFKIVEIWFNDSEFKTISDVECSMINRFLKSIAAVYTYDILETPGFLYVKSRDPTLQKVESDHIHVRLSGKLIKIYIAESD
jgi:hypothetical protein